MSCDELEMMVTIVSIVVWSIIFILEEGSDNSPKIVKFGQGP